MSDSPWRKLALPLLVGIVLLVAGVLAAVALLPAGRSGSLLPAERYRAQFEALARRQGVELAGSPRIRLISTDEDARMARDLLGEEADGWLVRQGRGLLVEVTQAAEWSGAEGQLQLTLTTRATPRGAEWVPATVSEFLAPRGRQPEGICGLMLGPGESLGPVLPWGGSTQGSNVTLAEITGARERAHVYRVDPPGGSVMCTRRPGDPQADLRALDRGAFAGWPTAIPEVAFVLLAVVLFVRLALRGRIDLLNALLLAAAFLVTCLLGDWPRSLVGVLVHGAAVPIVAVWLLVVWAVAESWARAHLPSFTTSLDTLRRGRLGARAGRELLLGFAGGTGLAGLRLLLMAGATRVAGLSAAGPAAPAPLFAVSAHPLREGVVWAGALLVLLTAAQRLPPALRWVPPLLCVPLLATPIPLAPWGAGYAAGLVATGGLLYVLHAGGIAAALVAATLAHWLPTAALAARHPEWLPVTFGVSVAAVLLPLLAGFVGLSRGEMVEHDPGAVPEFVRREERQRRLSHEMDLLARMQLGLLPQSLPRLAGYEVTARSILATEAGGDLYDFMRDDRGRLWIAAGDVSGHGYSCAIGQASVKASLLSLVDGNASPARILDRVDRVLRGSLGVRMFATLALLCLEESTGTLRVANAGHPFPVVVEPGKGARELDLPGLPLGQGPPRRYREVELQLPRGGLLLLFSDGLYEANDPAGRPYGFERPQKVLAEAASWNAAEVLERLLFDWRRHLAGTPPADDTTLVVLKRL